MDYSELQQLYMENEMLKNKINKLIERIKIMSPSKYYLADLLINCEYDYYLETYGACPHNIKTKDLEDSSYKTIRTLIEFFEDY